MYIETVKNRNSPPCILLRESYRKDGKVKKRTIANLTSWPSKLVDDFRALLKGASLAEGLDTAFEVDRSVAHGHVVAIFETIKRLGLDKMLSGRDSIERRVCLGLIIARIINPGSKLSLSLEFDPETASHSLGELLGIKGVGEDKIYSSMDWLFKRQERIEKALAREHLREGSLVLYDLTSTYFEGRSCPLARLGYSRDGKKGTLQIEFGLLCNKDGIPVAVEVFEGNTGDPKTISKQLEKVRERFGINRFILIGDRGMLTEARIREDLKPLGGVEWISALKGSAIQGLMKEGAIQTSLFDERDMIEITSQSYPGERLVVCKNPLLEAERKRKREDLLRATEKLLEPIATATKREKTPLKGKENISLRVGKAINKYKMAKHFELTITEESFRYKRNNDSIEREGLLDGFYVVRTSLPKEEMDASETVKAYKSLSIVESAFRCMKTVDLKVRPIFHRRENRVRAHVFLCMLAYYVEWHMKKALAPLLYMDENKEEAEKERTSPVAPAKRSKQAEEKARTKRNKDGLRVHSFQALIKNLASIARNTIRPKKADLPPFEKITTPTEIQQKALDLLGVKI